MHRTSLIVTSFAAFLLCGSMAAGQGLLDQLEKSLDRGAAPPATPPAEGDTAAPPAAAADELPAPASESKSGYLGVGLEEAVEGGIVVTEIAEKSPAETAGLKVGDKITAVNRADVKDIEELGTLMEAVPPGGKLTLTVNRAGKSVTIAATLTERPSDSEPAPPASEPKVDLGAPRGAAIDDLPPPPATTTESAEAPPAGGAASGRASLGVTVVTYDDEARRRSEVPTRNGALITQVRPTSPADRAGLPVGAVIVAYDGQPIDTADDLVSAIAASRPGDEVEITYYRGSSVSRKTVTLVAAADSSLLSPGTPSPLRDRSLLNRPERGTEGAARPGTDSGIPSAIAPGPAPAGSETDLREEVEALKAQIEKLEKRLADVEAKLAAQAAAGVEAPAVDAAPGTGVSPAPSAAEESAPSLRPPTRRPAATAPKLKIGDE